MATRAERAELAIRDAADWPDLLWALALNRGPVRRGYLEAVTGLASRPLVKALARLANEGVDYSKSGGYLEDRRPGANCDPYLVCARILKTICELEPVAVG